MIICAGLPKTGSKSCSAALRKLGYNVADFMETTEFLAISWTEYFDGKIGIDEVLKAYEDHGFDANQDVPGNACWEELYNASPKGTKVILTVRDNADVWQRSLKGFFIQEIKRDSIFGISVRDLIDNIIHDFLYEVPILVQNAVDFINRDDVRQAYRKHNLYVQSVVPKEDLLVWNLKEGWEPLCNFLGKEIPDGPIPHDNKTGDVDFIRNYAYRTNIYAVGIRNVEKNLLFFVFKIILGLYLVYTFFKNPAQ